MTNASHQLDPDCQQLLALRRTPEIFAAIAELTGNEFQRQQQLRSRFDPELVRAALTLCDLRRRASEKFSRAPLLWLDPKGLEQATCEAVAQHKAARFHGRVWDFCSGIGADSIAIARRGCQVSAVDLVPATCLRAQWNAEVYGVGSNVETLAADIETITDRDGLLHIDPDRRPGPGRRVVRLEDCLPGLPVLQELSRQFAGGAIKLSPASNFGGKFDNAEIELVSLNGECKEATVWFGSLAGEFPFRATALPSGETLSAEPLSAWTNVGELGAYLYDPDPTIVRTGLLDLLAERLGLRRLDDSEEYLTGDSLVSSPFLQAFEVSENLTNNDKDIRAAFRRHSFGQVEIKCRHIPIDVEGTRRKLSLEGRDPGVLIFTRQVGKTRAVICRRVRG